MHTHVHTYTRTHTCSGLSVTTTGSPRHRLNMSCLASKGLVRSYTWISEVILITLCMIYSLCQCWTDIECMYMYCSFWISLHVSVLAKHLLNSLCFQHVQLLAFSVFKNTCGIYHFYLTIMSVLVKYEWVVGLFLWSKSHCSW